MLPLHPHCHCRYQPYYEKVKKRDIKNPQKSTMSKFSLNEQRQIVGSYEKLQEFKNGVDIVELFNRVRPGYKIGVYKDLFDNVDNNEMIKFKSNYLKYNKDGYYDINGLNKINYNEILKITGIDTAFIEQIENKTKYKVEGAIIDNNEKSIYIKGIDKNRVDIPTNIIKGSNIIHSHPNGMSLSAEDVIEAITFSAKSVTAFNDKYLYIFKNKITDDLDFISIFNQELSKIESVLIKKVNDGTITKSQMDFSINHKLWLSISKKVKGFDYEAYEISR